VTEDKNSDLTVMLSRVEVLVVDDSRTLRRILIRELNTLGITHVVEASNGVEALAMAREKPPDLMLLDMEMPELDGLGVLQEMAKQSGVHHFPSSWCRVQIKLKKRSPASRSVRRTTCQNRSIPFC